MDKLEKVNPNNPKANSGAVLLKLHKNLDNDLDFFIFQAIQTLQVQFSKQAPNNPIGHATLTQTSSIIGKRISKLIRREPLPWEMEIRLGDLFIEALYNTEYIDIYYERHMDSFHTITITDKWCSFDDMDYLIQQYGILNTSNMKPKNIYNVFQSFNCISNRQTEQSVIKKWTEEDNPRFVKQINNTWVKSINKLQQTGWRINKRVLEAVLQNESSFLKEEVITDNNAKEMKRKSKNIEYKFIISKAKNLSKLSAFYQYLDADYRGRLYYSEPFLNFQGPDLARGLYKFARSKPMTDEGLRWLAIHTANSMNMSYKINEIPEWCKADYKTHLIKENLETISVDKWTLDDRVRWTNHHMDMLIQAGEELLFIEDAEKEVTLLACCVEWADIQKAQDEDRIHYTSLPISIDGSNNGWQHLGAISKDRHTGNLVGLTHKEIQNDFYVQTAKKLIDITTDEERMEILNAMPMKSIRKGISKRGSMTRAYSAGAVKIAENMYLDCHVEDYTEKYNISEAHCLGFAKDLITAINQVCPGPLETMKYLQDIAKYQIGERKRFRNGQEATKDFNKIYKKLKDLYKKLGNEKSEEDLYQVNNLIKELQEFEFKLVSGKGMKYISWITPSQFPVKYENYVQKSVATKGTISGYTKYNKRGIVNHKAKIDSTFPDMRGFMCGISPNFIHSMDASHMSLVIENWDQDFGAVHDSFSTHACDVDELLEVTKKVFVNMYDKPDFYEEIETNLMPNAAGSDIDKPQLGDLKITEVYESDYFFA